MQQQELLDRLDALERLAEASRFGRLLHNPLRYLSAMLFLKLQYPRSKKESIRPARLFFGQEVQVALPASTDIYLTGGKTHASEIRLARFLIRRLQPGDHFLDIGAHYGYFTLLAAALTGEGGRVEAYEPAGSTFELLQQNAAPLPQVRVHQQAVSDAAGELTFYEFPNLYSEYNSFHIEQFRNEAWFAGAPPKAVPITVTTLGAITSEKDFHPAFIKIDVEGAEDAVIRGGFDFLKAGRPVIAMEYLHRRRGNAAHRAAAELLASIGYSAHRIAADGEALPLADAEAYLETARLDSDNIIFQPKTD